MGIALRRALREAESIRFLCTGNMVRSAFAELYARHLDCPLPVDSAATVYQNDGLYPETRSALEERGVDAELLDAFRSRHLSIVHDLPSAGMLVFGMTEAHLESWIRHHPTHRNSFLLSEALGDGGPIADPVLDGADFQVVFRTVQRAVENVVAALR